RPLATAGQGDRFLSEGIAWSPDGATILTAASSLRRGVSGTVYAADARSGSAKPIGEPWANMRDIQWMPDGRSYLLTALDLSGAANLQIWRVTYPEGERT